MSSSDSTAWPSSLSEGPRVELAASWVTPETHRAATLEDVVELNDSRRALGLTEADKLDLVEYLKSL